MITDHGAGRFHGRAVGGREGVAANHLVYLRGSRPEDPAQGLADHSSSDTIHGRD